MALNVTITDSRINDQITQQTSANNFGSNNTVGTATSVHACVIVSAAAEIDYVKLYDLQSCSSSDNPDVIIPAAASATTWFSATAGITMSTGLSFRAVQEAGTPGTTNPSGNVDVKIVTT